MAAAMNRRDLLKAASGACAAGIAGGPLASVLAPAAAAPAKRRPNLLFLFTDDQRFDTIGALNNPAVQTPNLDRLVRRGTAFTHTYIQGSTSGAVCICSRAQLLCGRSLFRSPYRPPESLPIWPEVFRKAGYVTFGTGKWHNGPPAYARSFTHGGNIFFGGMSNHRKVPVHDFDPTGKYPRSGRRAGKGFSSNLFSDAAIEFLRRYQDDKPFFAYVSYTAPHDPRMAPERYAAMYPPEKVALPANFLPRHPFDNGELRIRDEKLAPFPRTPAVVRKHIAAYYAMITHVDGQIGRVLKALEEAGHADNTLVIFSGDNGLAVGQHGLMGKQNLYEHSVRVPLIFAGPGIPAGKRIDALSYLHEVFASTCQLAGVPVPKTVESRSLVALLTGRNGPARDSIFGAYKGLQRMVRDRRWKLIRYPRAGKTQLFDLQSDPWETKDLAGDPEHAQRIGRLNALLRKWQKAVGDTLDVDDPRGAAGGVPRKAKG